VNVLLFFEFFISSSGKSGTSGDARNLVSSPSDIKVFDIYRVISIGELNPQQQLLLVRDKFNEKWQSLLNKCT